MKALQKVSKFLSDYTSIVVIAIRSHISGSESDGLGKSDAVCGSGIQQVHMSVNHYRNHHV